MAAAPNVEGTNNADTVTGGKFGVVVGTVPSETVGFFGNVGTVQATGTTGMTVAQLITVLQAYGLIA